MRTIRSVGTAACGCAALLALSACGTEAAQESSYTIDSETGEISASASTADGATTVRSGAQVPLDLPAGFTLYPGAKVIGNTVFDQGDGRGAFVTMESADTPEQIAAFYIGQARAAGVNIEMQMPINEGRMAGGESPDGLTFSLMAVPIAGGTQAQLSVGMMQDGPPAD